MDSHSGRLNDGWLVASAAAEAAEAVAPEAEAAVDGIPPRGGSVRRSHAPHAALDASVDTWFGARFGADHVTITVDLGSYFTIDAMTITWK